MLSWIWGSILGTPWRGPKNTGCEHWSICSTNVHRISTAISSFFAGSLPTEFLWVAAKQMGHASSGDWKQRDFQLTSLAVGSFTNYKCSRYRLNAGKNFSCMIYMTCKRKYGTPLFLFNYKVHWDLEKLLCKMWLRISQIIWVCFMFELTSTDSYSTKSFIGH